MAFIPQAYARRDKDEQQRPSPSGASVVTVGGGEQVGAAAPITGEQPGSGSGIGALRAFFAANRGNAGQALAPATSAISKAADEAKQAGDAVTTMTVPNETANDGDDVVAVYGPWNPAPTVTTGLEQYQGAIDNTRETANRILGQTPVKGRREDTDPSMLSAAIQEGAQGYYQPAWAGLDAQIGQAAIPQARDYWKGVIGGLQQDYWNKAPRADDPARLPARTPGPNPRRPRGGA